MAQDQFNTQPTQYYSPYEAGTPGGHPCLRREHTLDDIVAVHFPQFPPETCTTHRGSPSTPSLCTERSYYSYCRTPSSTMSTRTRSGSTYSSTSSFSDYRSDSTLFDDPTDVSLSHSVFGKPLVSEPASFSPGAPANNHNASVRLFQSSSLNYSTHRQWPTPAEPESLRRIRAVRSGETYKCPEDGNEFSDRASFHRHVRYHHWKIFHICGFCDTIIVRTDNMGRHQRTSKKCLAIQARCRG